MATYAYLANAAEEEDFLKFADLIVFCLKHYEQYNLVTQIAIADLVRCYGYYLKDVEKDLIISAVDAIYPTGNLILDVLFSEFTIYKSFLLKSANKHVPDYMEPKDVEFYLAEQLYDLGEEKPQKEINKYAKYSIYRDSIMHLLDLCDVDYEKLYKKLHTSSILTHKMQEYVDRLSQTIELNTVYKSYEIQYALHAIIEKAVFEKRPELIAQSWLWLIPDYQAMYRAFKCRDIQPVNHVYDKSNLCEAFLKNDEDEYILIGRYEIKKHFGYHEESYKLGYQGIVENNNQEYSVPFQEYLVTSIETGEGYAISNNSGQLIDFRRTIDLVLEDENFLWPGITISRLFDIHIQFDFLNRRYIAVNQEGDIVFIVKNWSSNYKGDSEYPGNAIPLYCGTELYIKREKKKKLEQKNGKLKMKTYVEVNART